MLCRRSKVDVELQAEGYGDAMQGRQGGTHTAGFASRQAATVADNINALAQGRSDLTHYESWGVAIAVPIGPTGGAGQFPGQDEIVGSETIAEMKGREPSASTSSASSVVLLGCVAFPDASGHCSPRPCDLAVLAHPLLAELGQQDDPPLTREEVGDPLGNPVEVEA